eukprot:CAMPEP_0170456898 /NCGR_PEP_ID=MMETSP0123-20130129/4373_1 /TAXON_ID=182087 /ORGANISM="Favella ehrenbergii, Strain Fehren 1" /LENGTH=251 /DNA_ID=CAMNT_0010720517 /DNA_START=217 /DNA_END=971 /DNA_ORIENTATION=-
MQNGYASLRSIQTASFSAARTFAPKTLNKARSATAGSCLQQLPLLSTPASWRRCSPKITSSKPRAAYVLNLYTLGVPHSVVVDDYIPFINDKPMGAQMTNDGSLWPLILEKAFAKVRGNYLHISGGKASSGVRYMRGGPVTERETTYMTPDQIWDFISSHLANGDLLTAGTKHGKDTHTDDWGIVKGHAYTIAGVKVLSDGTKLIRARNPWGKDSYMGDFGATSELWTDSFADEVPDAKNADDGYIYLPIK